MALDGISERYAAMFGAMRPQTGATGTDVSAEFAAFLPDETARQAQVATAPHAGIASRILQVGLHRYVEEKQEVEKLMRVLDIVRGESDREIRKHLDKIVAEFRRDPPVNGADGLERIKKYIDAMPNDEVKIRMKKAFDRIKELLEEPDEALERLEKEAHAKDIASAMQDFGVAAALTT